MGLLVLLISALISLAGLPVPNHAAAEAPALAYWKAQLDQTPVPKVITDGLNGSKDGLVNINPNNVIPQLFAVYSKAAAKSQVDGNTQLINYEKHVLTRPTQVYSEGVSIVDPELIADGSTLFFLEKTLTNPTANMKLHFATIDDQSKFLPFQVSKSIPFSSNKLPKIFKLLSIDPKSGTAKLMEETIKMCEARAMPGEEKSCATSLESMVDYAVCHVGNKVKVYSTEVNKETTQSEHYMVQRAVKIKSGRGNLVCHKLSYPYAVFYCHKIENTDPYDVSLVGVNGKKSVKAIAVCHKDTSNWNPGHLAFKLLNVKPGSVPICHFLNVDTIIWVSSY